MLEFIIYGLIHEGDWDLTQPQATLLAGVISGVLLIAAAYIAFHGQREQRAAERLMHEEQMDEQRRKAASDLEAARTQLTEQLVAQRQQFLDDIDAKERIRVHEMQRAAALMRHAELQPIYANALSVRDALREALLSAHRMVEFNQPAMVQQRIEEAGRLSTQLDGASIELSASLEVAALDADLIRAFNQVIGAFRWMGGPGTTPPTNAERKQLLDASYLAGNRLRNAMRSELEGLSQAGLPE
ncbi:hypothetical protein [Rhodococcus erythropolis]|uniref:Uncharacterized protein n=1 Tax=Rhodococcus erythropolis TaxID=1833 RepID=A0A8I1A3A6_RHOER|nr:hypothetical protein [Rhodococcus erythropolis]MBH5146336.1 hypothetical protein [Rhodococcus erythropolis]